MSQEEFRAALADAAPPADLSPALRALWHDGRGDWDTAHRAGQDNASAEGD